MRIDNNLINSFLSFYKNEWYKEKTLYRYRYDFMAFFHWLCENKTDTIEAIDKLTIEEYKWYLFSLWGSKKSRYWLQEKLCSWTINQKLVIIKKFLEFTNYVFDLWLDYTKVRLNKVKYKTWDYFTKEEISQILELVNQTEKYRINQLRLKLIIVVCFVSWARLNEMRQITIQWIMNWKQKIIWKWDKERYLFFNDDCKKLLMEYLEEQNKPIPRIGQTLKRHTDYAIIWHWYENFWNQIGKQTITEMFKKLNQISLFNKHITLHTLRHSFATYMVDNWTNVFHLKELMGHEKVNTTAWYYHKNWNILHKEQSKAFSELCLW